MIVEGEVVGVLTIDRYEPDRYTEADAQILETFAQQSALAIRNARLYEALRESEERFRAVWEISADALALSDAEGIVVAANPAYLDLYGFTAEEVIGQLFNIIFPEAEREQVLEQYKAVFASPLVPPTFESVIQQADGSQRIVETTIGFITQDGERTAMLSNIRDVTQQRHLEEQLRQSQKMEAVGQLAGGVAHHYNNLLTTIMGYVGLSLTELPGDHPITKDLERIQQTVRRAASLTRQLLAFTRKEPTKIEVVNLNDLIVNMKHMLDSLISSTILLRVELATDLGQVKIDASQFEQVLVNLVVNARDAMPEGGNLLIRTANVSLEEEGEISPGDYVQLIVQDTGHGMSDAVRGRIFEPFFTTKDVGEGTGLGLSTCYAIVSQHRGFITVDSELEQGTTFKIYLSCHQQMPTPEAQPTVETLPGGQEIILLVEDDENIRDLATRLLRRQGYTVYEAGDGQQVLALLEEQTMLKPDLLLTDLMMPHMGGQKLTNLLTTQVPDLRVLFISGYKDRLDADNLTAWNRSFLAKPFTLAQLAQSVRAALDVEPMSSHHRSTKQQDRQGMND